MGKIDTIRNFTFQKNAWYATFIGISLWHLQFNIWNDLIFLWPLNEIVNSSVDIVLPVKSSAPTAPLDSPAVHIGHRFALLLLLPSRAWVLSGKSAPAKFKQNLFSRHSLAFYHFQGFFVDQLWPNFFCKVPLIYSTKLCAFILKNRQIASCHNQ